MTNTRLFGIALLAVLALGARSLADDQTDLAELKQAMDQAPDGRPADQAAMTPDYWGQLQGALAGDAGTALDEALQDSMAALRPRDLAGEARRLRADQLSLLEQTRRLDMVQQAEGTLQRLAVEQEELAAEAARDELSANQTDRMKEAASPMNRIRIGIVGTRR